MVSGKMRRVIHIGVAPEIVVGRYLVRRHFVPSLS